MIDYRAPRWLPGGHAQTLWPALVGPARVTAPVLQRMRWTTPDGDFIDADALPAPHTHAPLLVLFHGLEGSAASPYARALAAQAQARGWGFVLPHFRGCSGELNRAPRAYHSGDAAEVGWMLAQASAWHPGPLLAAGVSLGGNALLCWAAAQGRGGAEGVAIVPAVAAAAALCAPLDLVAAGTALEQGLNRWLYTPLFLRTMQAKAAAKLRQHPGLFDGHAVARARTLRDFDAHFTAPLHGFASVMDYWTRASAGPRLREIMLPTLVLNPLNDPFVPATSLPRAGDVSHRVTLCQPAQGGHVGFATGPWPGRFEAMPAQVCDWLARAL